jgi:NitT/TauT family transport system substrate-binding protein
MMPFKSLLLSATCTGALLLAGCGSALPAASPGSAPAAEAGANPGAAGASAAAPSGTSPAVSAAAANPAGSNGAGPAASGPTAKPAGSSSAAAGGPAISPAKPAGSNSAAAGASGSAAATKPAGAAGGASTSGERAKLTVAYNSPDSGYLALWIGQDGGIFQQNGLDVTAQLVSNGTQTMAALLSSQVQFVQTGGSAALSPAIDGANLTLLTVLIPVYSYLLEANPNIKTPADLKGQKLGVGSLGDSGDLATRVGLRKIGLDPEKDVSVLSIGGTPVRAAALRNGAIQAAVTSFPENLTLEKEGFKRLLDLAELKLPAAGQSTIGEKSWISSHKDVTQRYVDSLIQSLTRAREDRPFAIATMKKWLKSDDDQAVNLTYDYYTREVFPLLPDPKAELFADAIEQLSKTNDKVKGFDLSKLIDPSFVNDAKARGLGKS